MARCDEDIVVLDTRTDLYTCLAEAGDVLNVRRDVIEGPEAVLDDLGAAGLVSETPPGPRLAVPPLPVRALAFEAAAVTFRDELAVLGAMAAAWRRGPGRRPLHRLLPEACAVDGRAEDPALIARLTAGFVRRLPWDPAQDACLYRAWVLRRILQSRGQTATWVFGVRTWPFGAHCWLQCGDAVLDDDPDRVAHYTPIMAV